MNSKATFTLITGASKGIGKAFAVECAKRKMNVLLIARNESLLTELKSFLIKTYPVNVEYLSMDLAEGDACLEISEFITEKNISVNILINNVGTAWFGNFGMSALRNNLQVIKLNIDINLKLTHWFIQHYDKSSKAYLLNVISTAAFQAIPNLSTYSASKAFILSFTRSLEYEQRNGTLFVSALCPGGTDSEFFVDSNMDTIFEKNKKWLMDPSKVAAIGLSGLLNRKKLIIPGITNKLHYFLSKIIPQRLVIYFAAKIYE